jgi:hypothetical protein
MEILKHLFGMCGEPHLNILTLILSIPIIKSVVRQIKIKNN